MRLRTVVIKNLLNNLSFRAKHSEVEKSLDLCGSRVKGFLRSVPMRIGTPVGMTIDDMITKEKIIETLKTVKDPEVNLDVWTMGLIYNIEIKEKRIKNKEGNEVKILMTYTTPFCPWGPQLNEDIEKTLKAAGAKKVDIEITFDPPYKMPEELRTILGV